MKYTPKRVGELLDGVFNYSAVKWGDIDRNHGDVVVINVEPTYDHGISFEEYIKYFFRVRKIEQDGRFINIYFARDVFRDYIDRIIHTPPY